MKFEGKVEKIASKSARPYLGIFVPSIVVKPYLQSATELLGHQADGFFDRQQKRDRGHFHVTVVSPREYTPTDDRLVGKRVKLELLGVGRAGLDDALSYFIVVDSDDVHAIRDNLGLAQRDLHITIGFMPKDVHGVHKGRESLVTKVDIFDQA